MQSVPSFLRGYWALSVFSTMEGCCRLGGSTSWVGGFENSFGKGSTGWKSEGARHHAFLNQGSLLDLRNKMLVKGFWGLWVQCCSPARSRPTGRRPSRVFHRYRCWQQPWACEEEEAAQGAQAGRSKSKSDRVNSNTFNTKGPMQPAAHASK